MADIQYSARYHDDTYEYRHVHLPDHLLPFIPNHPKLLAEHEWRSIGIQQVRNYSLHV